MICQSCAQSFVPTIVVRGLTVCPGCRAGVVVEDGRKARMAETTTLSKDELGRLRGERIRLEKLR